MSETESASSVKRVRVLPSWLCIILFMIGCAIVTGILSLFYGIIAGNGKSFLGIRGADISTMIGEAFMLIAITFMSYILLRFGENKTMSELGFRFSGRFGDIMMGFVVAFLIISIGFYLLYQLHVLKIVKVHFYQKEFIFNIILFLMVAISEELMMRGYILGRLLRTKLNKYWALIISAAIFSIMHAMNSNISFLPLFSIFLAGILLGATYIYTHNLAYPISLHFFWNFIQGPVLGYNVSGMSTHTVFEIKEKGSTFLAGGKFGFEGSVVCIVLVLIFIGFTFWIMENKKRSNA